MSASNIEVVVDSTTPAAAKSIVAIVTEVPTDHGTVKSFQSSPGSHSLSDGSSLKNG